MRFLHDTEGRLTSVISEANETYIYSLDALGRVREETGFDGRHAAICRRLGPITKAFLPSGHTTESNYDQSAAFLPEAFRRHWRGIRVSRGRVHASRSERVRDRPF